MALVKVDGADRVVAALNARSLKSRREDNVVGRVGYSASYAIYVHENLQAYHPVGQAKYLEQPMRQLHNSGELTRIVNDVKRRGGTMYQAILAACLRIQRESQLKCPIDTGHLRASAFTEVEQS